MSTRVQAEKEFLTSLSRYVGYTTGADVFDRFIQILNKLDGKPAIYEFEAIEEIENFGYTLNKKKPLSEKYASGVLDFVTALGLLKKISGEKRNGQRLNLGRGRSKLGKYEISDVGRAIRSAVCLNNDAFKAYLVGLILATNDADFYCLILECFSEGEGKRIGPYFKQRIREIRESRVKWINANVKHKVLRRAIADRFDWLELSGMDVALKKQDIPDRSIEHYVSPRKKWAYEYHVDESSGRLTDGGVKYFARLSNSGTYFWIGPSQATLDKLPFATNSMRGKIGPPRDLLRTGIEGKIDVRAGIDEWQKHCDAIAEYMRKAYPHLKLVSANQASIGSIHLFCNFLEYEHSVTINSKEMIEKVIKENSKEFGAISSRYAKIGHYRLRMSGE
ncbi:MAG: hypothetical protein ACR2PR_02945 [Pseudohongiellaceae bacterium]